MRKQFEQFVLFLEMIPKEGKKRHKEPHEQGKSHKYPSDWTRESESGQYKGSLFFINFLFQDAEFIKKNTSPVQR